MLDENLPTFRYKPSPDNPLSSILYFTQRGDEPDPAYLFRRADPALPASREKYAVALCDAYNPDVVYAEVTLEPEWTQPSLSAAEIRAQAQNGAPPATATAVVPDSFTIQLYNPDQSITVKMVQGGWNKSDSWEFELPVQTFKLPSASELDRDPGRGSPADIVPRVMFRWKKDGRLSKDMTCYLCGKNMGGRKNKEPDITVALFKAARDSIVTIYEPNLHRVEVEDRKGLELVILFGAEVIKDLYISPKMDIFNVAGSSAGAAVTSGRRKNSRPSGTTPPVVMAGELLNNSPPSTSRPPPTQAPYSAAAPYTSASAIPPSTATPTPKIGPSPAEIEAETRRLQAMVEREEREREKKERAEQKRIKKMLEEEEKEQRKREADIAKETERLRKKYGVEGQGVPESPPVLPPRTTNNQGFAPPPPPHWQHGSGGNHLTAPMLPPRPLSAGPGGPFRCEVLNNIWQGPGGPAPPPHMNSGSGSGRGGNGNGRRREEEERRRVRKKRSMGW